MGGGKIVGILIFVVVVVSAAGGGGENHHHQQQKWWKWMSSTSAAMVNPVVSSSIVLPLYGNVYPLGYAITFWYSHFIYMIPPNKVCVFYLVQLLLCSAQYRAAFKAFFS